MNDKTQTEPVIKHFHLVTGNILYSFIDDDGQEQAQVLALSATVMSDSQNFPVASLVKAQRNLQAVFFTKVPQEIQPTIRDLVVTNVSHLAHMDKDEFYALPPEITQAQTDVPAQPDTVDGQPVLRTEADLKAALAGGGVKVQ